MGLCRSLPRRQLPGAVVAMRRIGVADLLHGSWRGDRVFFHNLWFRTHNNVRMSALLPRLNFVDTLLITPPAVRLLRGVVYRALQRTRRARYRAILGLAGRRYSVLFTNGAEQAGFFPGRVVVDMGDPLFSQGELSFLGKPNVAKVVVTAEEARERYRGLGLKKEIIVIPQRVELGGFNQREAAEVAARLRKPGEPVVGFQAAWLLSSRDRDGDNPLYNVDGLLRIWNEIHTRVPGATLWLIGQAGPHLARQVAGRHDIRLLGYIEQSNLANVLACLDVAVYLRRVSHIQRAVKVAEWLALGIPVVGFDLPVLGDVRRSGGGILVASEREFVDAVCALLVHPARRACLAERAHSYGRLLDWDGLADRDVDEVFTGLVSV